MRKSYVFLLTLVLSLLLSTSHAETDFSIQGEWYSGSMDYLLDTGTIECSFDGDVFTNNSGSFIFNHQDNTVLESSISKPADLNVIAKFILLDDNDFLLYNGWSVDPIFHYNIIECIYFDISEDNTEATFYGFWLDDTYLFMRDAYIRKYDNTEEKVEYSFIDNQLYQISGEEYTKKTLTPLSNSAFFLDAYTGKTVGSKEQSKPSRSFFIKSSEIVPMISETQNEDLE